MTYYEYAIEAGGTVISNRTYDSYEDAVYECVLRKENDMACCGRIMVDRRVVRRKVTVGEWEPCDD